MSNLKFCTHCGAKLEVDMTHCGACQKSVALMLGALPAQSDVSTVKATIATVTDVISALKQEKLLSSSMPSTKLESNWILKSLIRDNRLARGVNIGNKYSNYPFIVAVIEPDKGNEDETLAAYLKATSFKHDMPLTVSGLLVIASTAGSKDSFALDRFGKELDQFLRSKYGAQALSSPEVEMQPEEIDYVTIPEVEHSSGENAGVTAEELVQLAETNEPDSFEESLEAPDAYDDALTILDLIAESGLVEDIDDEPDYLPEEASSDWENGNLASFLMGSADGVEPECVRVVIEMQDSERGVEAFLEHEEVVSSRSFEVGGFTITLIALVASDRSKLPKLETALREALGN